MSLNGIPNSVLMSSAVEERYNQSLDEDYCQFCNQFLGDDFRSEVERVCYRCLNRGVYTCRGCEGVFEQGGQPSRYEPVSLCPACYAEEGA